MVSHTHTSRVLFPELKALHLNLGNNGTGKNGTEKMAQVKMTQVKMARGKVGKNGTWEKNG